MTIDELEQALDRWGADLGDWPATEAERARALLAIDAAARRKLDAARKVDDLLRGLRGHAAPAHLAGRIMALVRAPDREADHLEQMLRWLTGRIWRPAMLAMLMVTAGFLGGLAAQEPVNEELAEDVMTLAFSDIYAELDNAQP